MNDTSGSESVASLGDFILKIPDVGLIIRKTKVIPPVRVVNELLNTGKCDAGMSGCFEWEPFEIDADQYNLFKATLENDFGDESIYLEQEDISLKKWMSLARSQFRS